MKRFAFFVLTAFSFVSCLEREEPIEFRAEDMQALDVEYKWAVVSEPYVACRESPSHDAKIVRNLRKGSLEKVVGNKTVKTENDVETWIALEDGWIPANSVTIHANRLRAESATAKNIQQ